MRVAPSLKIHPAQQLAKAPPPQAGDPPHPVAGPLPKGFWGEAQLPGQLLPAHLVPQAPGCRDAAEVTRPTAQLWSPFLGTPTPAPRKGAGGLGSPLSPSREQPGKLLELPQGRPGPKARLPPPAASRLPPPTEPCPLLRARRSAPGVPGGPATAQAVAALPRAADQPQSVLAFLPDAAILDRLVQKVNLPTQGRSACKGQSRGHRAVGRGERQPRLGPTASSPESRLAGLPGRCSSTRSPVLKGTAPVPQGS